MATTKVRRVRVGTRLSVELRARLTKYCAASGISERTIIEDALRKYLDASDNTAKLLGRFDRLDKALARDHRDLELLSEAFGRYLRLWCGSWRTRRARSRQARPPHAVPPKRSTAASQHIGEQFAQGHRFVDDLPVEALAEKGDKE